MDGTERFSVTGQRALVTGASRGIGRAIAIALASAGADVALVARSEGALAETAEAVRACGRKAVVCRADLAEPGVGEGVLAAAEAELGPIDILVHAAGTTERVPSAEASREGYERIMQVNVASAMELAQAVGRRMLQGDRGGAMVLIASLLSSRARPTILHYTMSKTAMVGLVRTLAAEWGPSGIRVNALAPGYIRTELTRPLQEDSGFNQWVQQRTPVARWGEPEDIAAPALFLASPAAGFVNGQVLYVDGGWTAAL